MRVLVTGGAGYVGCSLVEKLSHDPQITEIVVYDDFLRENYNLFTNTNINGKQVKFIRGNIIDNHTLSKALQGIDIVYHLAAKVVTPEKDIDSHFFDQVNHWGTSILIGEIEKSNVKRFIYLSTVYVYGQGPEVMDTSHIPNPNSFYGISKLRGEEQVARLSKNIESYIIRSGSIYGYNDCVRFDVVINQMLFQAHYYNQVTIHGEGNQIRPYIHIDKLTETLEKLTTSKLASGTYNVIEHNASIVEIVEALQKVYPGLEYNHVNRHIKMKDIIVATSAEVKKELNWTEKPFNKELEEFKDKLI